MSHRWRGEGTPPRPLIVTTTEATRIASGRKTQLRRMARNDKLTGGLKACGMRPGTVYEVQTSTDANTAARIMVTNVVGQALVDITYNDARAEGHRTRADFADAWMRRHDNTWPLLEETLCPKCEGAAHDQDGGRCDGGCDDVGTIMREADIDHDTTLEIFRARHPNRWVWVVTFELVQHLYLHRKTDGGYTADPREALLDAGTVLAPPSADWARHAELQRREALRSEVGARLAGRGPTERLEELQQIARERRIDASSDARVAQRATLKAAERLERKILTETERAA